jgi:DNA-binding HxlR family transcriptional regulator
MPGAQPDHALGPPQTVAEHAIIVRKFYEEHPPRTEDLLTEKGRALGRF